MEARIGLREIFGCAVNHNKINMLQSILVHRPVLSWPALNTDEEVLPPVGHFEERIPLHARGISPKPTSTVGTPPRD